MPKMVESLTASEAKIRTRVLATFTEEQICAFFLTKTVRSQYRFDDDFITSWYAEIFGHPPKQPETARRELVLAYTQMLMFENKYTHHLDYWIRHLQTGLVTEIFEFLDLPEVV